MTDNRTTELLCKLLEERGIEFEVFDVLTEKAVTWYGNVCHWVAVTDDLGLAVAVYKDYLTPEQAIAATLGSGTCEQVLTDCDDGLMPPFTAHCSACGAEWGFTPKYCHDCGAKVTGTRDERKAVER